MVDQLKRALLEALGRHPTLAQRREAIEALEQLAEEQRQIITAYQDQARRSPGQRVTSKLRSPKAGPGAPPGQMVRWSNRQLQVGRDLWYQLGGIPPSVSFQFEGSYTYIYPKLAGQGEYTVINSANAIPRITCKRAWEIGQWAEGARPGVIVGNAIRFHIDATEE